MIMTTPKRILGSPLLFLLCRWAASPLPVPSTSAAFVVPGPSLSFVATTTATTSDRRAAHSLLPPAARRLLRAAHPPPVGVGPGVVVRLGSSSSGEDVSSGVGTSSSKKDEESADAEEKEKLTVVQIAEMIEATFVNACLQLATGYVDVLKLFVVAVKAGYENGIPIPTLIRTVEECPTNTAGRDLMDEERALRDAWINVVYIALGEDGHYSSEEDGHGEGRAAGESVDVVARNKFGSAVADAVKARRSSPDGKAPSFEDARDAHPELLDGKGAGASALEVAVASQSLRVADLTLTVVDEERECHEGGGAGPAPKARPPIPGAFKD